MGEREKEREREREREREKERERERERGQRKVGGRMDQSVLWRDACVGLGTHQRKHHPLKRSPGGGGGQLVQFQVYGTEAET